MTTFIIIIVVIAAIVFVTAPLADKLAREMEQRRFNRQMEIERLEEENRKKYYSEYLKKKNRK